MRLRLFVMFLALVPLVGCADQTTRDSASLQGKWDVVEFKIGSQPTSEDARKEIKIIFSGDKMQLLGGDRDKREFTFKLDPTKKPKAIDTVALDGVFKGKTNPGIYELQGDDLKVCIPNDPTDVRPDDFKTEGTKLALLVLKRAKQ